MEKNWKVCTNNKDVNHAAIMKACPVTCALAQKRCTSLMMSDSELRWTARTGLGWNDKFAAYTCADMEKSWHVCTVATDVNHDRVNKGCPVTCLQAMGFVGAKAEVGEGAKPEEEEQLEEEFNSTSI